MKRVVLVAVLSMSVCFAVRAEDTADEAKKAAVLEEARQHVARAKVHYDLGEFKDAADEYIIVYRLRPIPALLFNIAQAYRQGGLYDKAKSFYKAYLREVPDAKNRPSIEQSIHEMDQLMAKEKKTREAPPSGVKEPPEASLPIMAKKTPGANPEPAAKPAPGHAATPASPPEWGAKAPAKVSEKAAEKPAPANAVQAPNAKVAVATTPAPAGSPWTASQPAPAAARAPLGATSATQAPAVVENDSILKKWWLWTAVGVVVVGAGAAAMTMGGNSAPGSHFGTTPVFP